MTTRSNLLTPALAIAFTGIAFGQADECSAATDLGTGSGSMAFDTNVCSDTMAPATTSAEQQCFSLSNDVWFKYTASATGLTVFSTCNNATFDTEIGVWDGGDCSTMVGLGCNDDTAGCSGLTSEITLSVVAGQTYHIQVGYWSSSGSTWGAGTLTVTEILPPPNDDCTMPIAIMMPGSTAFDTRGAGTSGFDGGGACGAGSDSVNQDIFYTFTIPTAGDWAFDTFGSAYDTKLSVHSGTDCNATCAGYNDDTNGLQSRVVINGAMPGDQFLVQVGGFGSGAGSGSLNINQFVDPCGDVDMFEPNTDCTNSTMLGDGSYPGLSVQDGDNDYFAVGLDDGATMTVDIFFIDQVADVDLYLWDPNIECDTNIAGTGGAWLARGFSASDDESISYTNTTGAAQNLIIEIDMFTGGGCNFYDMDIFGTNGMGGGGIGTNYCMSNANSTGVPAVISASGSRVAANNDVTLTTTDMPQNAFGFYLVSDVSGFVPNPGGSEGNLCLGGGIGRYVGPGQIMNAGAAGEITLVLDITVIPRPMGNASAMGGDTWFWTTWYRDSNMGASTSNFSDGIQIDFL